MEEYLERRLKALDAHHPPFTSDGAAKARHQAEGRSTLNQIGEKSFYYLTEEELRK